ncbi:PREDICTED: leukocyte-associated immunoglobulin-like receptor 1 [Myotis brandtii]|uniref:leukocyte-associated immunoglobulin-like receptor 1 n=1 Tax=Myotis brandtii TaxID=109478 RepID=UPI0007046C35|nr:PREDICTED: leukocyte-associated immunoglobulin-like receptor 1 [Myotis brandtii]
MMEPEILLCFLPGPLPKPSLRAEPGPVVPRGRPVTFVCNSSVWAEFFRLEKGERTVVHDHKSESSGGEKEARFHFPAMSKVTAGRYRCLYKRMNYGWSQLSEPLLLQVTEEDDSTPHSGAPRVLSSTLSSTPSSTPSSAPSSTSVTDTKPLSAGE